MIEPIRLLAFAFAGADLLFEIDRNGTILFATGATSGFAGSADLVDALRPIFSSRASAIASYSSRAD